MTINIEKMRADMARQQSDLALQQKWETRKFLVQVVVGAAACVGAGVALANYVNSHRPPEPAPQPQIIYLQPTPPPAAPPAVAR